MGQGVGLPVYGEFGFGFKVSEPKSMRAEFMAPFGSAESCIDLLQ